MNYVELSAAISAYTENTEDNFIAEIPVFVKQAEQRIYNSIQFPSLRKNMTGVMQSGNKYLSAPSDFLAVYSLAVVTDVTGGNINGNSSLTLSTATGSAAHTHALVADIQLYANSSSDSFRNINAVWQLSDNNGNAYNHASFGGGALVANSSSISEILINFGVTQTDGMYLLEGSNSTS